MLVLRTAFFHHTFECRNRASSFVFEELYQCVLTLCQLGFQCGEGDFRFFVTSAFDTQDGLSGTHSGVIKESFVNVAYLLNAKRTEGNAARF